MSISRQVEVVNWAAGERGGGQDRIAGEVAVALTYNRVSHVVMMATPQELEDFGLGFSLTEGIIDEVPDLLATRIIPRDGGMEVAMRISQRCFERLGGQRRNLTGRTGCGLCGAESLEQAVRYPKPVSMETRVRSAALQAAIATIGNHQPLRAATGAAHYAAWCGLGGEVLALREDVGRHNALDKLIGHLCRIAFDPVAGFVVVSSRASYEMVFKAAAAGMELLAAVSAPTTMAVDFAHHSGLTLIGFARPGRHNIYTFPERIIDDPPVTPDG